MTAGSLVSVIVPARNSERTIVRTLQSLLRQTDPSWEALIIDDGSTDRTPAIIAEHSRQDPRFVSLTSSGRGGISRSQSRSVEGSR